MIQAEIEALIVEELTLELKNEENFDADMLSIKVKNSYREVKAARNYPSSYSEKHIEKDMERYFTQIKAIALYDYSKIGAEGQDNYNADGESIKYSDRKELFSGVLPIAVV